jgi:hypothetical protein
MWQKTLRLAATLRLGRASQVTSHAIEHMKTRTRVCTHRKSLSLSQCCLIQPWARALLFKLVCTTIDQQGDAKPTASRQFGISHKWVKF